MVINSQIPIFDLACSQTQLYFTHTGSFTTMLDKQRVREGDVWLSGFGLCLRSAEYKFES